jgi:hypothetical protein
MNDNTAQGTNTLLIVLLIILVVGGLVWFLSRGEATPTPRAEQTPGTTLDVDVNLPETPGGSQNETAPGGQTP